VSYSIIEICGVPHGLRRFFVKFELNGRQKWKSRSLSVFPTSGGKMYRNVWVLLENVYNGLVMIDRRFRYSLSRSSPTHSATYL